MKRQPNHCRCDGCVGCMWWDYVIRNPGPWWFDRVLPRQFQPQHSDAQGTLSRLASLVSQSFVTIYHHVYDIADPRRCRRLRPSHGRAARTSAHSGQESVQSLPRQKSEVQRPHSLRKVRARPRRLSGRLWPWSPQGAFEEVQHREPPHLYPGL